MLFRFLLVFLFLFPTKAVAGLSFFDQELIYQNPVANVRSPLSSFFIKASKYRGENIYYLDAILGKEMPLITYGGSFKIQLGLEAAAWILLGYSDGKFPVLSEDFLMAVPLSFRYRNFSGVIRFNHISSHLGDGIDMLVEETLSKDEKKNIEKKERLISGHGVGVTLKEPISYSRDFMSVSFAYDLNFRLIKAKSYMIAGYVHKMIPDYLKRWFGGAGGEISFSYPFSPYFAHEMIWNQDVNSVDHSGQFGVKVLNREENVVGMKLVVVYFIGKDRRGQFLDRNLKEIGLGIVMH